MRAALAAGSSHAPMENAAGCEIHHSEINNKLVAANCPALVFQLFVSVLRLGERMRIRSRGRLALAAGTSAALLALVSVLWLETRTVPIDHVASPPPRESMKVASPRPGELIKPGRYYTGEEPTAAADTASKNAEQSAVLAQSPTPPAPEAAPPSSAVPEQRLAATRPLRPPPQASTALTASPPVMPTRIFSGPTQYPPATFAAYGIVAFTSLAAPAERERYEMMCQAYVTTLLHYSQVAAPHEQQMVTVWPIDSDDEATHLNRPTQNNASSCKEAIDHYGLYVAKMAIEDAKKNRVPVTGRGWSPATNKGQIGALVLRLDLSKVTTLEQAKERFNEWSTEIAENPELWESGWNIEKLRTTIRFWADHYGPGLLQVFGGKG